MTSRLRSSAISRSLILRVTAWMLIEAALTADAQAATPKGNASGLETPEQRTARVAKLLKPIPDKTWKEIAGARIEEKYEIIKGDTLFGISQRLFGNPSYWPKIWALNNNSITNPHQILPGRMIAFLPGTGTSLPAVSLTGAATETSAGSAQSRLDEEAQAIKDELRASAGSSARKTKARSNEWKLLPQQPWESNNYTPVSAEDSVKMGTTLEKTSAVRFHFELEALAASEKIQPRGKLKLSNALGTYFGVGSQVLIENEFDGENKLQIGETYAITQEPTRIRAHSTSRKGYSYPILGTVKILGSRNDLFVGYVKTAKDFIQRGSVLIPLPDKIPHLQPIPGPEPKMANIIVNPHRAFEMTAQYEQAFIDLGSEDGIKPGMVFQVLNRKDGVSGKRSVYSESAKIADVQVIQVSERFSVVVVIDGQFALEDTAPVMLVTDLDAYLKRLKDDELLPKDDLDQQDPGGGIKKDEEAELKALENATSQESESGLIKEVDLPPPPGDPKPAPTATPDDLPPPLPDNVGQPQPDPPPPPPPASSEQLPPPPPGDDLSLPPPLPESGVPGESQLKDVPPLPSDPLPPPPSETQAPAPTPAPTASTPPAPAQIDELDALMNMGEPTPTATPAAPQATPLPTVTGTMQ